MKQFAIIASFSIFLLPGCQKPLEVEAIPDPTAENALEVSAISVQDTDYVTTRFDSISILPSEQLRFAGRLTVGKVTHDAGHIQRSEMFSRVLFENRERPVQLPSGRVFGYHGINLGTVLLEGAPLNRIAHRVPLRRPVGDSVVIAGFEYLTEIPIYQSNHQYTWNIESPDSISPFSVSIISPDEITVQSPAGGSTIERNRDLSLRWIGSGRLSIIISGFEPISRQVKPILRVRPRVNNGTAVLSSKFLRLLPNRFRFYVFTFVLANRNESTVVGGFQGRVLVQSASMYNSYVELR